MEGTTKRAEKATMLRIHMDMCMAACPAGCARGVQVQVLVERASRDEGGEEGGSAQCAIPLTAGGPDWD